jgi:membrane peptidoglycan carboxypeptidase
VVSPTQLPAEFRKDLYESLEGTGDATLPIDPDNWQTITDGMAQVTQPGYFHTAGSAHLEGIDLAGKTGTAQVMSHEALGKTNKGHHTLPNVWFVGVVPRRNPELVIAVLWEHGEFSYFPARLGARLVAAYVEKQRRLQNNLMPVKAPNPKPVEVGAVWTTPNPAVAGQGDPQMKMQAGKFYVGANGTVAGASGGKPATPSKTAARAGAVARNHVPSAAKSSNSPDTSAHAGNGKPAQQRSESARLSSQPALPGKPAQVKSQ